MKKSRIYIKMYLLNYFQAFTSKALSRIQHITKSFMSDTLNDKQSTEKSIITNLYDQILENVECKSFHCFCYMQNDYFWLHDKLKTYCLLKFQTAISKMNHSYEFKSMTINTHGYKDTSNFTESLFLFYMYLKGHLWGPPCGACLSLEYHLQSENILTQLCIRGIYTIGGCNPNKHTRSSHTFVVVIHDTIIDDFIALLQRLFNRGVNVYAKKVKMGACIREYMFARQNDKLIYTDNLPRVVLSTQQASQADALHALNVLNGLNVLDVLDDFGLAGMFSRDVKSAIEYCNYSQKEKVMSSTCSLFYVHTWSQTLDSFRVEDVLMQLWLPFNGKFGCFNNGNATLDVPFM